MPSTDDFNPSDGGYDREQEELVREIGKGTAAAADLIPKMLAYVTRSAVRYAQMEQRVGKFQLELDELNKLVRYGNGESITWRVRDLERKTDERRVTFDDFVAAQKEREKAETTRDEERAKEQRQTRRTVLLSIISFIISISIAVFGALHKSDSAADKQKIINLEEQVQQLSNQQQQQMQRQPPR